MKSIILEDDMLVTFVLTPIDYSDCFEIEVSHDIFPNDRYFCKKVLSNTTSLAYGD